MTRTVHFTIFALFVTIISEEISYSFKTGLLRKNLGFQLCPLFVFPT